MAGLAAGVGAKAVLSAAGARLGNVSPKVWLALGCAVALALGVLWHRHEVKVTIAAAKAEQRADDQKVLDETVQSYRAAQADAKAKNDAQVQHVEQQYQRNSTDEREAYLGDLAKLRAARVRPQAPATPAAPGSAGGPDTSAPDASAPRIDADGLCVPADSDVCEAGAEIELRLMHLQNWADKQAGVDPNAEHR